MSSIKRNKIKKLILKEFKMMGMADMGHGGLKPMGMTVPSSCDDEVGEDVIMPSQSAHSPMGHSHKGSVSREDCCAAVMCVIECCECPITKQALIECCQDILSGRHDR